MEHLGTELDHVRTDTERKILSYENVSPTMCPRTKVLGECVCETMRPLDDASLTDGGGVMSPGPGPHKSTG